MNQVLAHKLCESSRRRVSNLARISPQDETMAIVSGESMANAHRKRGSIYET